MKTQYPSLRNEPKHCERLLFVLSVKSAAVRDSDNEEIGIVGVARCEIPIHRRWRDGKDKSGLFCEIWLTPIHQELIMTPKEIYIAKEKRSC